MGILDRLLPAALLLKDDGTKIYSRALLRIYDLHVLWLNNSLAWRCPTKRVLLPLYRSAMGPDHLEMGVGTGYYPATALAMGQPSRRITLADLNPNTLEAATSRIHQIKPSSGRGEVQLRPILANAMEPLPLPAHERFDSISLFFLLHCIPLAPEAKTQIFDLARQRLRPSGTLVGCTVLGQGVKRNLLAELNMRMYNGGGIFHNWADSREVFEGALRRNFEDVETDVVGCVMTWRASRPRPG